MRLKESLLLEIFSLEGNLNKYSKAITNLVTVKSLEEENNFDLGEDVKEKINSLEKRKEDFRNGIPLKIVENYFNKHKDKMTHYVYLQFKGNIIQGIYINELYLELEDFYEDVYYTASLIADYYNLEPKLKQFGESEAL